MCIRDRLQHFAENAIWQGLLHSTNPDKQLRVRICEEEDYCVFTIEDNGIGRQKSREMKSTSAHVKKSFGMKITDKRVELFNKNFSSQIQISVNDVVGSDGEVAAVSYTHLRSDDALRGSFRRSGSKLRRLSEEFAGLVRSFP